SLCGPAVSATHSAGYTLEGPRDLGMRLVVRQRVGNRQPAWLRSRPHVHPRAGDDTLIEHAQRNTPKLRQARRLVPQRRATCAAEGPEAAAGVIFRHGGAGCFHDEVGRFGERPCGRARAGELPAIRAMAVARAVQRPGDLESDASAEAAGLHDRNPLAGSVESEWWLTCDRCGCNQTDPCLDCT